MTAEKHMSLGAFLMATGHHLAGWRHPDAQADGGLNLAHYQQLARTAERGLFDAIFLSDTLAMLPGKPDVLSRLSRTEHFEPLTLLSALSASTTHIGLVATATTSYNQPEDVAASFLSLERLSRGRSGWNLVTSRNAEESHNFGRHHHFAHADRYRHAANFHRQVQANWREAGVKPVVVLAGASVAGCELAARIADIAFTAQPTLADARQFYQQLKQRVVQQRREPDSLKIMPGIFPIVGHSQAEAEDIHAQLSQLVSPEAGLGLLADALGDVDLSGYPLDGPIPELPPTNSGLSRQELLVRIAQRDNLSIRQLYQRIADARGHAVVVGTAAQVADHLEEWFLNGAADGFNVMPPYLPDGLDRFVDLVIPELQRRGLFRTAYQGNTLRGHLGLN